jgi:flagellar hook-associated protein 1 FlgK
MPLFVDGASNKLFTNSQDGGSQKTGFAGRISVNTAVTANPTLLIKYSSTTQSGDPARAQKLADLLTSSQFNFGEETGLVSQQGTISGTVDSFINTITSYWGGQSETAKSALDSQNIIQANVESRYSNKSSVNIDEEMARLIQIQSAYAANARVFSVARDMLDTLMKT